MDTHSIAYRFNALPADSRKEVLDFIDFLTAKRSRETTSDPFNFTWEGGLYDLKDKYNSVSLQHRSMEWR
uniref:DUF2281 domain-containing protein n=1 Tax=Candidatus Kentrum sp. DK TaxID=2126562 RepID=A0A450SKY8_9GAMM|nr:MAG: Protein of unknown function (DUF2281) [Candidatus Kentron sp. DK]